jgi:hypothetical protein
MLRPLALLLFSTCASLLWGCEVLIGDECTSAAECSQEEPRLCLTQALEGYPGGYCTIFNCDPGTCPGEAVCVGYRSHLSTTAECSGPFAEARLQRTFCMRSCNSGADCRPGYACIDLGDENPWGAEVLERGRNTKVCALAYSGPEVSQDRSSDVCRSDPNAVPLPTAQTSMPTAEVVDAAGPPLDAASASDAAGPSLDAALANDAAGPSLDAAVAPDASAQTQRDASP